MGVLACDRSGCSHIMCERIILDHSMYICRECYDELLEYKATWSCEMKLVDVEKRVREFMYSDVGTHKTKMLYGEEIDEEFARLMGEEKP
jgi:hypothetical protein